MAQTTTFRSIAVRVINQSGAPIPLNGLMRVSGFAVDGRSMLVEPADLSDGAGGADLIALDRAIPNNSTGYGYQQGVMEGVNTVGQIVGNRVYADPATPGGVTYTAPSGIGQDTQVVGRVVTVAAAGRIHVNLLAGGLAGSLSADLIESIALAQKPLHYEGNPGQGYVYFSGVTADGERITINGRIYEFDTNGVLAVGANVAVDISGGNSAAQSATALAAAINADASRVVDAVAVGPSCLLTARVIGTVGNYALVETCANGALSAATLVGGTAAGPQRIQARSYTLVAADVTALAGVLGTNEIILGVFPQITEPILLSALGYLNGTLSPQLLDTAQLRFRQLNAGFWGLTYREPAGGALFAAADSIRYIVGQLGA